MGKATDDEANESCGFHDVALTLSNSRSRQSVGNTYVIPAAAGLTSLKTLNRNESPHETILSVHCRGADDFGQLLVGHQGLFGFVGAHTRSFIRGLGIVGAKLVPAVHY